MSLYMICNVWLFGIYICKYISFSGLKLKQNQFKLIFNWSHFTLAVLGYIPNVFLRVPAKEVCLESFCAKNGFE